MVQTSYISNTDNRTGQASQFKSIQSWKQPKTLALPNEIEQQIETALTKAQRGEEPNFQSKLIQAYAPQPQNIEPAAKESFRFKDIVDIVNPLHHIPIVGSIYREMTDDQLHPISQIIGGSLYGGPVGAVAGTANAVTQMNTGQDISAHAFDLISPRDKTPAIAYNEFEGTTLALADLANPSLINKKPDTITSFKLSPMPESRIF